MAYSPFLPRYRSMSRLKSRFVSRTTCFQKKKSFDIWHQLLIYCTNYKIPQIICKTFLQNTQTN